MKRRLLALMLCLCVVLAWVPVTAQAAVSASDARVYLDILNQREYAQSYLIDFDQDGRDELLAVWTTTDPDAFTYAHCGVWQGDRKIAEESDALWDMGTDYGICRRDGKFYLRASYESTGGGTFFTVQNGQWVKVWEYHPEASDSIQADRAQYESYELQYMVIAAISPDIPHSDVRPQLQEIVYQTMTPKELLEKCAYLGDKSRCRMTSEQAAAFAAVIEAQIAEGERIASQTYNSEGYYRPELVRVAIFDAGDGVPALWVCRGYSDTSYWGTDAPYWDWDVASIWEWDGANAVVTPWSTWRLDLTDAGMMFHSWGDTQNIFLPMSQGHISTAPTEYYLDIPFISYDFCNAIPGCTVETVESYSQLPISYVQENVRNMDHSYDPSDWMANLTYDYDHITWGTWEGVDSEGLDSEYRHINAVVPCPGGYDKAKLTSPAILQICKDGGNGYNEGVYMVGEDHWIDGATAASLLRAYSKANLAPTYPLFNDILNSGWESDPVAAVVGAVPGEAAACYSLTDGMCYVLVKTSDGFQGVLVQAHLRQGQVSWQVLRTDAEPAAQETLSDAVNDFLNKPNLTLDFNKLRGDPTMDELADYLRGLFDDVPGKGPNDMAKRDLAAFLDAAISTLSTATVSGEKNHLTMDGDAVSALSEDAWDAHGELTGVLEENNVVLNQTITPLVRAVWSDMDPDEPCQVDLDQATVDALDGCDLQVLLGDGGTYLELDADDLDHLVQEADVLQVQFSQTDDNVYDLRFLDGDGEVIEQLSAPVTVALPATGPLNTVMVSYAQGSDNWGGQYDAATGSISFEARYSGTYEVLENNVAIDDIAGLGDESRTAIAFMVSKGYLSAENGLFRPGDPLTRYEFTQALVGMFFALDRDQTCDFPDVDPSSPYYPYVASAQAKSIVNGYSDGTFSGNDPINREQVFALAARTLMDQKGYTAPADFEQYLSGFADRSQISDWAADQVAMSVREGIASRGEALLPQENITREQAAVVLYRLFCLLYEVSPVPLDVPEADKAGGLPLPAILGISAAAILAVGGAATGVIVHKKRKKKANNQTPVG